MRLVREARLDGHRGEARTARGLLRQRIVKQAKAARRALNSRRDWPVSGESPLKTEWFTLLVVFGRLSSAAAPAAGPALAG